MRKVLIYYDISMLKPVGGPSGYLYSLNKGLKEIDNGDIQISFLPPNSKFTSLKKYSKTSKKIVIKYLLKIYRRIKHINGTLSILQQKKISPVDLSKYDAVHFHTTKDIYFLRDQLADYEGKIILTSHSPQPLSQEYIDGSSRLELALFGGKYSKLIEMDEFAFERADNIVFPCIYADEAYCNIWKEYAKIKESKKDKYRYLLTGTDSAILRYSRKEIRNKLNIPEDAFVISYVGRHNEVKGYDRLKKIGNVILGKHPNVYILVAGNIGPLMPVKNDRWIEVGWTDDPHSLIAASDVFILPNKETYFDLVLLEVLSLGTIIVASNTGGNKYFEKNSGIKLFNSEEKAVSMLEEIMKYPVDIKLDLMKKNKELFAKFFTIDIFAKKYLEMLRTVL